MTQLLRNKSFLFWMVLVVANACTIGIGGVLDMPALSLYGFVMAAYCGFFASRCLE